MSVVFSFFFAHQWLRNSLINTITLGMLKKKSRVIRNSFKVGQRWQILTQGLPMPTPQKPPMPLHLCAFVPNAPPQWPLPIVVHVLMISTPFIQPDGGFCVFVVFLSLLLTTTLKGCETEFMMPHFTEEETANQWCEFPQTTRLSRGRVLVSAKLPIASCVWGPPRPAPSQPLPLSLLLFKTEMRSTSKNKVKPSGVWECRKPSPAKLYVSEMHLFFLN